MKDGVWAVICNYDGGEENLTSIKALLAEGIRERQVVFVDNASSDGSPEAVRAAFPDVVMIRNDENTGYGHATNQGIRHALDQGAEFVFLVNNDLFVVEGSVQGLVEELQTEGIGITGPRIVYARETERIWCAGGMITWRQNLSTMIGHRRPDSAAFRTRRDVDYVPGCAMMVRREVFERIGLLTAEYFAYHEDVEFCLEAVKAGFRVRYLGDLVAHHDAHHTTGGGYNQKRKYMMGVNTVHFLREHGNLARWASFLLFDVASLPFVWAWRVTRGEGASVCAKARGTWDGLLGRRVTVERLARFG